MSTPETAWPEPIHLDGGAVDVVFEREDTDRVSLTVSTRHVCMVLPLSVAALEEMIAALSTVHAAIQDGAA